ncbi:MAG: hypothetical protein LBV61_08320 [Burkholderiaceae bacterium]|jgi:tetratricopeptide (TPR) repeat protein|nr:hypothetical protein [Burkholderiaceae bacterium]
MRKVTLKILLLTVMAWSFGPVSAQEQRIDDIPMYGQPAIPRPENLKKADEDFINEAVAGLGTREAASKAWFAQGEEFLQKRNLDFAMRRYNQAWLLNPNNYQPYWGFGRVMLERGKFDEAIDYLERSKALIDDQYQRIGLIVDLGTAYSVKAEAVSKTNAADEGARFFALANHTYNEALSLDPKYGNGWWRWAMSLYEQGDYAQAWEKVQQARAQNARPFPPAFLRALEQKMPEPRY